MATYNVRLEINVPSIGLRTVDQPGISAPTMEEAIAKAKSNVTMTPILVQQTAP